MMTTTESAAERRSSPLVDYGGGVGPDTTTVEEGAGGATATTAAKKGNRFEQLEKRIFNTGPRAGKTLPMSVVGAIAARRAEDDVDSSVVCVPSIAASRVAHASPAMNSAFGYDCFQVQPLLANDLSNLSSVGSLSNLDLPGTPEKPGTGYGSVVAGPSSAGGAAQSLPYGTVPPPPLPAGRGGGHAESATTACEGGRKRGGNTGEKPKRATKRKVDGHAVAAGSGVVGSSGGAPTPPSKAQRNITDFIVNKSPKRSTGTVSYHATVNGDSSSNDNQQFIPTSVSPQPHRTTPNHLVTPYASSDSNQSPPNGKSGCRNDAETQTDMRLRGLPSDEDWGDEARDDETAKRDALIEEMRRKNDELQQTLAHERRRVEASKETIKRLLIEQSTLERKQAKEKCMAECLRIGNFKPMRQGEHFKDVWADGYAFEEIQKQQNKISTERNEIVNASLTLRKRKPTSSRDARRAAIAQISCPSPTSFSALNNALTLVSSSANAGSMNHATLDSPTGPVAPMSAIGGGGSGLAAVGGGIMGNGMAVSLMANSLQASSSQQPSTSTGIASAGDDQFARPDLPKDFSLQEYYEQDEIYRLRKEHLKKEEAELVSERDRLERERNLHIRELKRLQYEESSRYKDHELLNKRYLLLSLLGKGGFSEVWRAFDLEENRLVACKIHHVNKEWKEDKKANYVKHAMREKDIHKTLDHPRIVKLFDLFTIDNHSFCTVLEYCDGNDLDFYLKQNKQIPEKEARSIIMQIVSALKYLSEKRPPIIHYDLKPANILLQSGTTSGAIKITDFGLSKVMEDSDDADSIELTSQGAGTYWYLPPETFVVGHQPPKISSKVDVWSVGVILYQCLYGKRPFGHEQTQQKILEERTILNAKEVNFPTKPPVTQLAQDFIRRCLQYKKEERADVQELSKHELFRPRGQKASQPPSSPSARALKLDPNDSDL